MSRVILLSGSGNGISSDDVTATANLIASGLTAVTRESDDEPITGTMNRALNLVLTIDGNDLVTIVEGYHTGSEIITLNLPTQGTATYTPSATLELRIPARRFITGTITIKGDANLVPENIKPGVTIGGVGGITGVQGLTSVKIPRGGTATRGSNSSVNCVYSNYDTSKCYIVSGDLTANSTGTFYCTFRLRDTAKTVWADGTIEDKRIAWYVTAPSVTFTVRWGENYTYTVPWDSWYNVASATVDHIDDSGYAHPIVLINGKNNPFNDGPALRRWMLDSENLSNSAFYYYGFDTLGHDGPQNGITYSGVYYLGHT